MTGDEATSSFAGEPQPVEVHHSGTWYSGELLGWRFDESGRALARVRCVVDGLRHSTWKDLSELRLPGSGGADEHPAAAAGPVWQSPPRIPERVLPWRRVGRHEAAAPSRVPEWKQPPPEDDDTRPHALLVDRDVQRRPPVPRPRIAPRSPSSPDRA